MSIAPEAPRLFNLGLVCAKTMDDAEYLNDLLGEKVPHIGHLYTSGANDLVVAWARENGIVCTVYPINAGRGLPWSNSRIIEASDFVYVIGSEESKSAGQAVLQCEREKERRPAFKHRLVAFEAINHWRAKVCRASEILDAQDKDAIEGSPALKALKGVL